MLHLFCTFWLQATISATIASSLLFFCLFVCFLILVKEKSGEKDRERERESVIISRGICEGELRDRLTYANKLMNKRKRATKNE